MLAAHAVARVEMVASMIGRAESVWPAVYTVTMDTPSTSSTLRGGWVSSSYN